MKSYKQKLPVLLCLVSAAALLTANLFLFNTFEIYRDNADEFELGFLTLLKPIGTWGGVFIALTLAPALVLSLSWLKKYTSLLLALGILTWVQASFLLWDYGEFDGRSNDWAQFDLFGWLDIGIWVVFLALALRFSNRLLPLTHMLAWILIVGQTVLLYNQQGLAENDGEKRLTLADDPPEALFEHSRQQNIVHIVLDSMQSDVFLDIVNQLDLHDELTGFTLYYENAGVTPHTSLALPAIFSGKAFDASQSLAEYYQYAMTDGFQSSLFDAGYTINLVPQLSMRGSRVSNHYKIPSTYTGATGDLLNKNAASLMDVALFRGAPHFLRMSLYDEGNWFLMPMVRGDQPVQSFQEKAFLSDYVDKLSLGGDKPAYHFIHLWPPHPPYVTDADGQYAGEVLPNNRENYLNEAKAVMTHIVALIQRLKSMGVYEDALIVLQGDHGSQVSPVVNGNVIKPCVTRIPTMLAVKLPGVDGAMQISDAPTSLLDVAATMLTVLEDAGSPRFNLEDVPVRQRPFLVFDGKGETSRIKKYVIEGSVYDPDSCQFEAHLDINANVNTYQPGTEVWFGLTGNGGAYMGAGWSMCQTNHCWSNGRAANIVLPITKVDNDLQLQLRFKPYINAKKHPQQRIDVSVNGTSVTTWVISESDSQTASIRIPAGLAADGLLNINLQFPDAVSPKALNLGGDTRALGIALTGLRLDLIDSQ